VVVAGGEESWWEAREMLNATKVPRTMWDTMEAVRERPARQGRLASSLASAGWRGAL
jgi:hypothetical protein